MALALPALTLSAALLTLSAGPTLANEAEEVSITVIEKAWKERQDRVKSGVFTWTETRFQTKGSLSALMGQRGNPKGKVIPPTDFSFEVPSQLSVDGEKLRYEYEDRQWSEDKDDFVPSAYVSAFNGDAGKFLYPNGLTTGRPPQAGIRPERHLPFADSAELRPLLTAFRGLIPGMRYIDIQEMAIPGRRAVIDGVSCIELELQPNRLWVDPTRDFVVSRFTLGEGKPTYQITVRYDRDTSGVWVPDSWEIINYPPGGSLMTTQAKMKEYKINPSLNPKEFDLEFPPGTMVIDTRSNRNYIVNEQGGEHALQTADFEKPYQDLLEDVNRQAPGNAAAQVLRLWPWAAGAALLVAAAWVFVVWRRGRIRRSSAGRSSE
jgi:hypothetical protein